MIRVASNQWLAALVLQVISVISVISFSVLWWLQGVLDLHQTRCNTGRIDCIGSTGLA